MISTEALRRLADTSAAFVAEQSNDNYGPYLLHQAAIAWGSPAVVAWRKALEAREAGQTAEPPDLSAVFDAGHAAVVEAHARRTLDAALQDATP